MALSVQRLFERMAREFAMPATSDKSRQDFLDALNDALGEMNDTANTDAARVTAMNQLIDLDDTYQWIVVCGLGSHLSSMGYKSMNEEAKYGSLWREAMAAAQMKVHKASGTTGKW